MISHESLIRQVKIKVKSFARFILYLILLLVHFEVDLFNLAFN